jgi:hypothetical protein
MTKHNLTIHRFNFPTRMVVALLGLLLVWLMFATPRASASRPSGDGVNLTSLAAAPNGGFWVQVDGYANGGASRSLAIDGAPEFENVPHRGSIAAIPGREGYWVVTPGGGMYARGDAPQLCNGWLSNCSAFPSEPSFHDSIVAAAATPDGQGLFAVSEDGKLWTAGTAQSFGNTNNDSHVPTGIVPTPSGRGYYIVLDDGGVYSFGDAIFHGSTGGDKPGGHHATGLAASLDASGRINGYWMVAEDGGVFTFGDAPFLGSTGGQDGGSYVTSITALPGGHAYAWVHGNGQVGRSETFPKAVMTSRVWGTAVGVPGASTTPGTPLRLMKADRSTSQQWHIWPIDKDGVMVQWVNVNSGMCADLTSNSGLPFLVQNPCKGKTEGWDSQLFAVIPDGQYLEFMPFGQYYYRVRAQSPQEGSGVGIGFYDDVSDPATSWMLTPAK